MYSSNPFVTSALEEGGLSATRFGLFTLGVDLVPIVQEAAWAPGPVWRRTENLSPWRFDPRSVHLEVIRNTDCAIL